jgi:hypothetical protein
VFDGSDREAPFGFTDSDWASDPTDCCSVSGYVYLIAGGAVSWSSRKQPTVALSSIEGEYMASTHATQEAIWMRQFFDGLCLPCSDATELFCDNTGVLALSIDPKFHARTKHTDVHHHFIRQQVASGEINLLPVSTHDNVADLMTKGLPRSKHEYFCELLGLSVRSH